MSTIKKYSLGLIPSICESGLCERSVDLEPELRSRSPYREDSLMYKEYERVLSLLDVNSPIYQVTDGEYDKLIGS